MALRLPISRKLSETLRPLALGKADRQDVTAVLDVYDHGNLLNFVDLDAVRIVLDRHDLVETALFREPTGRVARPRLGPVPPLPKPAELSDEADGSVHALAALHRAGVIPSLYFLSRIGRSSWRPYRGRSMTWHPGESSSELAHYMRPDGLVPADQVEPLRRALETFAGRLIGGMAVVGGVPRQALSRGAHDPS